ncbi:hypothetical protein [Cohnella hongkongensis]|uniref:Uncharacterized protein n=1 Tax=Cohnella hongkongensis TaxID=178337 RepID=A0ABV9FIS4_9BACL
MLLKKDNEQGSGSNAGSSIKDQYLHNSALQMEKYRKLWTLNSKLMSVPSPLSSPFSTYGFYGGTSRPPSPEIDGEGGGSQENKSLTSKIFDITGIIGSNKNYVEGLAIAANSLKSAVDWKNADRSLGGVPPSLGWIYNQKALPFFKYSGAVTKAFSVINPMVAGVSFATAQNDDQKRAVISSIIGSTLLGWVGQTLIPIPGVGYAVGSFVGSLAGENVGKNFNSISDAVSDAFRMYGEGNLMAAEGNIALVNSIRDGVVNGYRMAGEGNLMAAEGNIALANSIRDAVANGYRMAGDGLNSAWNNIRRISWNDVGNAISDGAKDIWNNATNASNWNIIKWMGYSGNERVSNSPSTPDMGRIPLNNERLTFQEILAITMPHRSPFYPIGGQPESSVPKMQGQPPINISLSPGAVQLSLSSNELDYDDLSNNIGIRITKAIQQALANRTGGSGRPAF